MYPVLRKAPGYCERLETRARRNSKYFVVLVTARKKPHRMIITQSYKPVACVCNERSPGGAQSFFESMRATSGIATGNGKRFDWSGQWCPIQGPRQAGTKKKKMRAKGPLSRDPLLVSRSLPQYAGPGCLSKSAVEFVGMAESNHQSAVSECKNQGNKGRLAMTRFRQF